MSKKRVQSTLRVKSDRWAEITQFERAARSQGFCKIAGVDEAGRGPLAGPVVAAACILPDDFFIRKIDDSKRLTAQDREEIFQLLTTHPDVIYGSCQVEADTIDQINILQATLQAMAAAIGMLKQKPDFVLIDGNCTPSISMPCQAIVKGDSLSQSIMAAAIIAKVTRDTQMREYDRLWPQYGFSSHKGYPTRQHLEALDRWGPSPIHRYSYQPIKMKEASSRQRQ